MLIEIRHRWYRFIVDLLLLPDLCNAAARKLLLDARDIPCTMDDWSLSLAARSPTVAAPTSPLALAEVYTMIVLMQIRNILLERLFSCSRRIALRTPQAKRVHFDTMNSTHMVVHAVSTETLPWGAVRKKMAGSPNVRRAANAWNALIHRHCSETWHVFDGKVNVKPLAQAWAAVTEDSE